MVQHKKGFTLYELLAVLAIMAIISAVSVPLSLNTYHNYQQAVFENECELFVITLRQKIDLYKLFHYGRLPQTREYIIGYPIKSKIANTTKNFRNDLVVSDIWPFVEEVVQNTMVAGIKYEYWLENTTFSAEATEGLGAYHMSFENGVHIKLILIEKNDMYNYYDQCHVEGGVITKGEQSYQFKI